MNRWRVGLNPRLQKDPRRDCVRSRNVPRRVLYRVRFHHDGLYRLPTTIARPRISWNLQVWILERNNTGLAHDVPRTEEGATDSDSKGSQGCVRQSGCAHRRERPSA